MQKPPSPSAQGENRRTVGFRNERQWMYKSTATAQTNSEKPDRNEIEDCRLRPACAALHSDADLAAIVERWPLLPAAIKIGIKAIVKAAVETGNH